MEINNASRLPCTVYADNDRGRHLVASNVIREGEVIFQEIPVVIGPYGVSFYQPTKAFSTCLGCYKNIQTLYRCSKCGWPVCGMQCENIPDHANFECKIFAESPVSPVVSPTDYEKIKILRILLLKEKCPAKWEMICGLESHESTRRQSFFAVTSDIALYKFIKQECHLTQFDFEEIHHVAGVSSHSFPANGIDIGNQVHNTRYASLLFYYASLLSHDCSPNTRYIINSTGAITVIATKNIGEGEPITSSYVDIALGSLERREILRQRYYINCNCKRCSDPTEFNTFFSAIKCKNCHDGYLLPLSPLDPNSEWGCNKKCCDMLTSPTWVAGLIQEIRSELSGMSPTWEMLNEMLEKHKNIVLHRNHYLIIEIQLELIKRMERFLIKFDGTSKIGLAKKIIEHSRSCLAVVDVIYPGCNTYRGRLLYSLHEGLISLCQSRVMECTDKTDQEIVRKSCKKHFVEVLQIIKEAKEILLLEPVGSEDWKKGTLISTESAVVKSLMSFFSFKN